MPAPKMTPRLKKIITRMVINPNDFDSRFGAIEKLQAMGLLEGFTPTDLARRLYGPGAK